MVDSKKQTSQFLRLITSGNQKWNGAAPSLINNLINRKDEMIILLKYEDRIIEHKRKIFELKELIKKYLIDASKQKVFLLYIIKGIIERILISNDIHINIQLVEFSSIITLKNKILIDII